MNSFEKAKNLNADRQAAKKNKKSFKNSADNIENLKNVQQLTKYIEPNDWIFILCAVLAVLKDLSALINGLPALGQALVVVIGFFISSTILLLLMLVGTPKSAKQSKKKIKAFLNSPVFKKFAPMVFGSLLEEIPILDVFPIETAALALAFYFTLKSRQEIEEERKQIEKEEAEAKKS